MNEELKSLIRESTNLELNVGKVYELFAHAFTDDKAFWWELVMEEKNHAAILRAGENSYLQVDYFPADLLSGSLDQIRMVNQHLKKLITTCENNMPSRELAFNIALRLEQSAGEIHFQDYMTSEADSEMDRIFKRLNQDDKDHAKRIQGYMMQHNIAESREGLPAFLK